MATTIRSIDPQTKDFISLLLASTIHGNCYHFAIAMNRTLHWPIVGLMQGDEIIHTGVLSPTGAIWDGRGKLSSAEEFAEPFGITDPIIKEVLEDDLHRYKKIQEPIIKVIIRKAQTIWPELPWQEGTFRETIISFLDELEELSRKYGLWLGNISADNPTCIFEEFGKEEGYEISLTHDGNGYVIRRKLE